jgi:hypothetical protein
MSIYIGDLLYDKDDLYKLIKDAKLVGRPGFTSLPFEIQQEILKTSPHYQCISKATFDPQTFKEICLSVPITTRELANYSQPFLTYKIIDDIMDIAHYRIDTFNNYRYFADMLHCNIPYFYTLNHSICVDEVPNHPLDLITQYNILRNRFPNINVKLRIQEEFNNFLNKYKNSYVTLYLYIKLNLNMAHNRKYTLHCLYIDNIKNKMKDDPSVISDDMIQELRDYINNLD